MKTQKQGTANITAQTAGTAIIAAPGASKRYRLKKLILTGKASTTSVISVTAGTTTIVKYTPDYGHPGELDFGEQGYLCAANAAITLVEETADCQMSATAIVEQLG